MSSVITKKEFSHLTSSDFIQERRKKNIWIGVALGFTVLALALTGAILKMTTTGA